MKVVVFHWGDAEKGVAQIKVMQELSQDPAFADFGWFHVDASVDENAAKEFSEANLPMVFTQTPEDGIEKFVGDFSVPNFSEYQKFRLSTVDTDNVKTCDSPACIVKYAQDKPVFLKMYESWCAHCKKMKKHFQRSSNEVDSVHFVEVECSKSGNTCGYFEGNGFPKVKLVNQGGTKFHDYKGARNYVEMTPFAQQKGKAWKFNDDLKWDVKSEL